MPGSSLWLVPPLSHPLHEVITTLISTTLPSKFPSEAGGTNPVLFAAHMTLTSEILPSTYYHNSTPDLNHPATDEEKQHAQKWLDALLFPPAGEVRVRLDRVDTQDVFFRRCFVRVGYEGVEDIVAVTREYAVTRGGSSSSSSGSGRDDGAGSPISKATREWLASWKEAFGPHVSLIYGSTPITDDKLAQISAAVEEAGVVLGAPASAEPGAGWDGGVVWLVPTDRPIGDWKPIATRTLA